MNADELARKIRDNNHRFSINGHYYDLPNGKRARIVMTAPGGAFTIPGAGVPALQAASPEVLAELLLERI